jgi:hypothetical protein
MPTIYGNLNPPAAASYVGSSQLGGTHTGADGDIFVRTSGVNPQWRFSANPTPVWTPIVPPAAGTARTVASDTRADTVPRAGLANQRLAKTAQPGGVLGTAPWALGWANAADGVATIPLDPTQPPHVITGNSWMLRHDLNQRWVDVTVLQPDGTTVIPEINYVDDNHVRLTFLEPVTGTAIVRR